MGRWYKAAFEGLGLADMLHRKGWACLVCFGSQRCRNDQFTKPAGLSYVQDWFNAHPEPAIAPA